MFFSKSVIGSIPSIRTSCDMYETQPCSLKSLWVRVSMVFSRYCWKNEVYKMNLKMRMSATASFLTLLTRTYLSRGCWRGNFHGDRHLRSTLSTADDFLLARSSSLGSVHFSRALFLSPSWSITLTCHGVHQAIFSMATSRFRSLLPYSGFVVEIPTWPSECPPAH